MNGPQAWQIVVVLILIVLFVAFLIWDYLREYIGKH